MSQLSVSLFETCYAFGGGVPGLAKRGFDLDPALEASLWRLKAILDNPVFRGKHLFRNASIVVAPSHPLSFFAF